jgi:hypothetical protein
MQANVSLSRLFLNRKLTSTLLFILFWIVMAATAFHAAAQDEKQSSEPTPHTEMWEPDRIPTPAAPRSGNYPSPARMPVMTISRQLNCKSDFLRIRIS